MSTTYRYKSLYTQAVNQLTATNRELIASLQINRELTAQVDELSQANDLLRGQLAKAMTLIPKAGTTVAKPAPVTLPKKGEHSATKE